MVDEVRARTANWRRTSAAATRTQEERQESGKILKKNIDGAKISKKNNDRIKARHRGGEKIVKSLNQDDDLINDV